MENSAQSERNGKSRDLMKQGLNCLEIQKFKDINKKDLVGITVVGAKEYGKSSNFRATWVSEAYSEADIIVVKKNLYDMMKN